MSPLRTLVTILVLAAGAGLAVALGAPPAPLTEWTLVAIAVAALAGVVSWLSARLLVTSRDPFEDAAAQTAPPRSATGSEVDALTDRVRASLGKPGRLRLRLAPVLREIAAAKLAAHDLTLDSEPAQVRAVLGDDVAAVLGLYGTPPPAAVDLDFLDRVVTSLERT